MRPLPPENYAAVLSPLSALQFMGLVEPHIPASSEHLLPPYYGVLFSGIYLVRCCEGEGVFIVPLKHPHNLEAQSTSSRCRED